MTGTVQWMEELAVQANLQEKTTISEYSKNGCMEEYHQNNEIGSKILPIMQHHNRSSGATDSPRNSARRFAF